MHTSNGPEYLANERIQNERPIRIRRFRVFGIRLDIWRRSWPLQLPSLAASGKKESDAQAQNHITRDASHNVPVGRSRNFAIALFLA